MLFSQRALSSFPHNLTRSAPTPVLLASVPCPSPCPFWFPVPYILTVISTGGLPVESGLQTQKTLSKCSLEAE